MLVSELPNKKLPTSRIILTPAEARRFAARQSGTIIRLAEGRVEKEEVVSATMVCKLAEVSLVAESFQTRLTAQG